VVEYSIAGNFKPIRRIFGAAGAGNWWRPRYNVAPTQLAPVVRIRRRPAGTRRAALGFDPVLGEGPQNCVKAINARAETVATAPVAPTYTKTLRS
jgi:putative SOS response-associated peptidase YedK